MQLPDIPKLVMSKVNVCPESFLARALHTSINTVIPLTDAPIPEDGVGLLSIFQQQSCSRCPTTIMSASQRASSSVAYLIRSVCPCMWTHLSRPRPCDACQAYKHMGSSTQASLLSRDLMTLSWSWCNVTLVRRSMYRTLSDAKIS